MNSLYRFAMAAIAALAISGCGDDRPAQQDTAAGEILPHSASDAMLPLDTVRSQAPLAAPEASGTAEPDEEQDGA